MPESNENVKSAEFKDATAPAGSDSSDLLGPKHKGMRISAAGLLGRISRGGKVDKGQRYVLGVMLQHLEATARRFYAGDVKAIDEFLQLYCLDDNRP